MTTAVRPAGVPDDDVGGCRGLADLATTSPSPAT
jgi:hypothetical protein